jgi:hypothetical protein
MSASLTTQQINLSYRPNSQSGENLRFSVCAHTAYVRIDKDLANLLVQPGNLDLKADGKDICTAFDKWWHSQMILSDDFNRA